MADAAQKQKPASLSRKGRIQLRLREEQLDEARVLEDYEARSAFLGGADHDYLRRLLVIGHMVLSRIEGLDHQSLALSINDSNNTGKEHAVSSNNESQQFEAAAPPSSPINSEVIVGAAIRGMAGVFGGIGKKATS